MKWTKQDPAVVQGLIQLKQEEREFEALVNCEGVFGYILERWNATPGIGYEHVESCFGFVGSYSETEERFKHYIVEELMSQIPQERKSGAK